MMRHTLPDGGWADVRDHDEITVRGRRGIMAIAGTLGGAIAKALSSDDPGKSMSELDITETQADGIYRMQEATLVAFLAGWSYEETLPTMATVGDLPAARYDTLIKITAAGGAAIVLDTSPTLEPDPKALTGN